MTVSTLKFPAICALALLVGVGVSGCSGGGPTSDADLSPPPETEPDPPPATQPDLPPATQPDPPTGKPAPSPSPPSAGAAFTAADVAEIDELTGRLDRIDMGNVSLRAISSNGQVKLRGAYECLNYLYEKCYHPWESPDNEQHGIHFTDFEQEDVQGTGRVRRATPVAGEGEILSRGAVTIAHQPRSPYVTGAEHVGSYAHLHGWSEFMRFGAWLRDDFGYSTVDWDTSDPRISAIGGSSSWYFLYNNAEWGSGLRGPLGPPDASATWTGHMLGLAHVPGQLGTLIHGDANLSYDLGSSMIDIRFDNIVETANPSRSHPDIVLDRARVDGFGQYENHQEVGKFEFHGRFFGTSSDETGGYFIQDKVEGVFAAVRQ